MRLVSALGTPLVLLLVVTLSSSSCVRAPLVAPHSDDDTTYEVACGADVALESVVGGRVVDTLGMDQPVPPHCQSSLHCYNCSFASVNAELSSVTLIWSSVQILRSSTALSVLHADRSSISTIRDLVISTEAQTARFEYSTINSIEKLTAMSDTSFGNCKIGTISARSLTSYASFAIANSSIAKIESDGITSFSGTSVLFKTVFIEDLQHRAVVVTGAGDLVLENVTISSCTKPCFEVASRENVKFLGHFLLNGTKLDDVDVLQMVKVRREGLCEPASDGCFRERSIEDAGQNADRVSQKDTTNFSGMDKPADAFIRCGVNTTLLSRQGSVVQSTLADHQTPTRFGNRIIRSPLGRQAQGSMLGSRCSINSNLTITNSSFQRIALSHPVSLRLEDSYVGEVRGPLNLLSVSNSRVGVLRSVAVSGSERRWTNASIGTIRDCSFGAEHFAIVNSSVTEQIRNLTVEGSFLVQESFLHAISSLRVLAGGYLIFQDSTVNLLSRTSIFLERGALISLSSASVSVWSQRAISLISYDQVLGYNYYSSEIWLPDLVSLRLVPAATLLPPTLRSASSPLLDRRFCVLRDHCALCDYSTAPMTDILHSKWAQQAEPMPRCSTYTNASSISLKAFGYSREMTIENTGLLHFPEFFEHSGSLLVRNSSFGWLHTRALYLDLRDTSAGVLDIAGARRLSFVNSSVATIAADVNTADFTNTFIETIIKMKITNHTVFTNCTIQSVGRLAIFVSPNATFEVRNSSIDAIDREGIIVEGNLIFDHVHVKSLSSFGLLLDKRGRGEHTLHKVTFGHMKNKGIFTMKRSSSYQEKNNKTTMMEEQLKDALDESNSALSSFLLASKNSLYKFISYLPEVLRTIRDLTLNPESFSSDSFTSTPSKKPDDREVNLTITFTNKLVVSESNSQPVEINVPDDRAVPDAFSLDSIQRVMPHYRKFSVLRGMQNIVSPYRICSHALHGDYPKPDGSSLQKYQIDAWVEFERCVWNPVNYAVAHTNHITRANTLLIQFDIQELWVQVLVGSLLGAVLIGGVTVAACCLARRIEFQRALRDLEADQLQVRGDQLSQGTYFSRDGSRIGVRHPGSSDALYLIKTPHDMAHESSMAVFPPISPIISQKPTDDHNSLNSSLSFTASTPDLCVRDGRNPSHSMRGLADSQTCLDDVGACNSPGEDHGHTEDYGSSHELVTTNSDSRQSSFSVARGVLAKMLHQSNSPTSSSTSSPSSSGVSRSTAEASEGNQGESSSSSDFNKVTLPVPLCNGPDDFEMEIFF